MGRTTARVGGGRSELREPRILAIASGAERHSLDAVPLQYPPKEESVLRSRTFYLPARTQSLSLSRRPGAQLRRAGLSEPRLQLHRDPKQVWPVLAPTTMHQCCLPGPDHPPERTRPATCARVGQHARVRQSTAAKKEGGSFVCGTEKSDRIAALASAQTEVRAGAVLPGGVCPEHQTTGAVPQSTDNTYYGSRRLAEVEWNTGLQEYGEEFLPITDFFNTHRRLRSKPWLRVRNQGRENGRTPIRLGTNLG